MELQNIELEEKIERQFNRKTSFYLFVTSLILFGLFLIIISVSGSENLAAAYYGILLFILILVTSSMSAFFFFKYKINKKNFALRNIPSSMALGIIIVAFIFAWHLILLTASRNLADAVQLSFAELIIVSISIILIAYGVLGKYK